jgi:hypothetical protein
MPVVPEPFIEVSPIEAVALVMEVDVSSVAAGVPSEEAAADDDVVVVSSSVEPPPPPVLPQPARKKITAIMGKMRFTSILSPYPRNIGKRHHTPLTNRRM